MGKQSNAKKERLRAGCYICRRPFIAERSPTKDHIIPDCWFPRPLPKYLPTAKACSDCQRELSPREERLRNVLANVWGHDQECFADLWDRASRSARRPQIVREEFYALPTTGVLVRAAIVVPDPEDFAAVFGKMVRGLFFKDFKRLLDAGHSISVVPLMATDAERATRWLGGYDVRPAWFGESIAYVRFLEKGNLENGWWFFNAFHAGIVAVVTGKAPQLRFPPARLWAIRPAERD